MGTVFLIATFCFGGTLQRFVDLICIDNSLANHLYNCLVLITLDILCSTQQMFVCCNASLRLKSILFNSYKNLLAVDCS